MITYSCRVTTHGERQLELDVVYPIPSERKKKRYFLDLYIFNPYQLGMGEQTYGVARFLRDMRSYTRYTTPLIPLPKLIDPSCGISPIKHISEILSKTDMARDIDEDALSYELRLLTNIYHAQIQETQRLLRDLVENNDHPADIVERLKTFLSDIDAFLKTFRAIRPAFFDPRISDLMRESLRRADEAISLSTEKTQYLLYDTCRKHAELEKATSILDQRLSLEQEYRSSLGYPTVIDEGDAVANEYYIYRDGMLKKWAEGCMFLNRAPARITFHLLQVLMSIAAATAMAVALIATFFTTRWFPAYSIPWAILIVVAYIVKDRLKDILRHIFIAHMPRLVADEIDDLIDPRANRKIGSNRARVRFCRPSALPSSVQQLRNIKSSVFANLIPPEDVIHFHKDICLDSALFIDQSKRLESLTEIMRLKLDSWLANMDDPFNIVSCIVNGKLTNVKVDRVYHVNMIISLSEEGSEGNTLFRYRLIVTRNGIVRIDHLEKLVSSST